MRNVLSSYSFTRKTGLQRLVNSGIQNSGDTFQCQIQADGLQFCGLSCAPLYPTNQLASHFPSGPGRAKTFILPWHFYFYFKKFQDVFSYIPTTVGTFHTQMELPIYTDGISYTNGVSSYRWSFQCRWSFPLQMGFPMQMEYPLTDGTSNADEVSPYRWSFHLQVEFPMQMQYPLTDGVSPYRFFLCRCSFPLQIFPMQMEFPLTDGISNTDGVSPYRWSFQYRWSIPLQMEFPTQMEFPLQMGFPMQMEFPLTDGISHAQIVGICLCVCMRARFVRVHPGMHVCACVCTCTHACFLMALCVRTILLSMCVYFTVLCMNIFA